MARVILRPEIKGISGKIGNMIFRTTKDGRTFVSSSNRRTRTKHPSDREQNTRSRFALAAKEVARRIAEGDTRPRKDIWREVYRTFA